MTGTACGRSPSLTLDRAGPAEGDVEVAHGGHEHGQEGEAVNPNAEEESGQDVAR